MKTISGGAGRTLQTEADYPLPPPAATMLSKM